VQTARRCIVTLAIARGEDEKAHQGSEWSVARTDEKELEQAMIEKLLAVAWAIDTMSSTWRSHDTLLPLTPTSPRCC
jgi:hypothetical protein